MRILFNLLMAAWFIWLIYRSFNRPQPKDPASTPERKKVDSIVIEKKDCSSDDDKP
jgi:hypothetical protein